MVTKMCYVNGHICSPTMPFNWSAKRIEGENDVRVLTYLIFSLWCCQGLTMSINQRSQELSDGFLHSAFPRFQYLFPSLAL